MLGDPDSLPLLKAELAADDEFGVNMELRRMARHAFIEAEASRRLREANTARHRIQQCFDAGDLIYIWRRGTNRAHQRMMKPTWMGPGVVLAHEKRQRMHGKAPAPEQDQRLFPGSVVWSSLGGRLIRSVPEHLRRASEEVIKAQATSPELIIRNMEQGANKLHPSQYEDMMDEPMPPLCGDSDAEFDDAQEPAPFFGGGSSGSGGAAAAPAAAAAAAPEGRSPFIRFPLGLGPLITGPFLRSTPSGPSIAETEPPGPTPRADLPEPTGDPKAHGPEGGPR